MTERKTYYVHWTYVANYCSTPLRITATSPEAALTQVLELFSDDFAAKGSIYIYESAPVITVREGRRDNDGSS